MPWLLLDISASNYLAGLYHAFLVVIGGLPKHELFRTSGVQHVYRHAVPALSSWILGGLSTTSCCCCITLCMILQVSMLAVRAALWKHQYPHNSSSGQSLDLSRFSGGGLKASGDDTNEDAHSMRMTSAQVEEVTKKLKKSLIAKMGADQSKWEQVNGLTAARQSISSLSSSFEASHCASQVTRVQCL